MTSIPFTGRMRRWQLATTFAIATAAGAASLAQAAPPAWTTLGTRATLAAPAPSITTNAGAAWSDYDPPAQYAAAVTQRVQYLRMRDGVRLAAYVTLPADAQGRALPGPFPVVLQQTAYNGTSGRFVTPLGGADDYIVRHGYATVVVDVRGTGQSEGSWEAFGAAEQADYAEVVNWAATQPFSDGRIGLFGASYLGITAMITAAQGHPQVKAVFPIVPIGDAYRDIVFTGGQINPTFIPLWLGLVTALGLTNPTALTNPAVGLPVVLDHVLNAVTDFQAPIILRALAGDPATTYDGAFWTLRSPLESAARITVPTFVVGGLYDLFQRSEPISYESLKRNTTAKLLIGPWTHLEALFGAGLPADGVPALNHIQLRWFDQYVKGLAVGAEALPNVTQYVTGLGHYATATDWPHPLAQSQRLYLRGSDLALSTEAPRANERARYAVQQPIQGLCSVSAAQWSAGVLGYFPLPCFENSNSAERWSVKYETPVLAEDLYLNGPIAADIWMSTTALDASLSVRVDDVDERGVAKSLSNGLQTVSLRAIDLDRSRTLNGRVIQPWHPYTQASVSAPGLLVPDQVSVEVFPTSALLAKGHRLRVSVGSNDLPQGVPPIPTLLKSLVGVLTIYSDAAHPSSVVLPVVPASALK